MEQEVSLERQGTWTWTKPFSPAVPHQHCTCTSGCQSGTKGQMLQLSIPVQLMCFTLRSGLRPFSLMEGLVDAGVACVTWVARWRGELGKL